MGKRFSSLILSVALVGGVFATVPARAQEAAPVAVPAVVQIEDPLGDANTLGGDQILPADGGSQTDIEKVWFSHDATNLNVHFLTEGPPTDNSLGFQFVVTAGEAGCLVFDGYFDGLTYTSENLGRVLDGCNKLERTNGTFTFGEGPDGKGLATITVPRSYSPLFADGSTIAGPIAQTWLFAGGEQLTPSTYRGVRRMVDDTKVGTDYSITAPVGGGAGKPVKPKPTPPGKTDPPGKGKKKGCDNGKGKKTGACPKPKGPASCPTYTPGEEGKDAATTLVTDAATAEKPIVVEFDSEMGLGAMPIGGTPVPYDETTRFFHNVQVDTAGADTGLYARLDFPEYRDYDLYLNYPDGSEGDHSGDFSTIANTAFECGGASCESTPSSEAILGLRTPDCGGWTAEMVSFLSEGGPVTLSLWLGEAIADPVPPGEGEADAEALSTFYSMTGLANPGR